MIVPPRRLVRFNQPQTARHAQMDQQAAIMISQPDLQVLGPPPDRGHLMSCQTLRQISGYGPAQPGLPDQGPDNRPPLQMGLNTPAGRFNLRQFWHIRLTVKKGF